MIHRHAPLAALLLAAACTPVAKEEGIDTETKQPFDKVAPEEVVTLLGTEPFWGLKIGGGEGTWTTPDNPKGTKVALTRFAGNNGLGFSGTLDGDTLTATLTPGDCTDGMSERRFPYVATIALGGRTLEGCGYTTDQPFTGDEGDTRP